MKIMKCEFMQPLNLHVLDLAAANHILISFEANCHLLHSSTHLLN